LFKETIENILFKLDLHGFQTYSNSFYQNFLSYFGLTGGGLIRSKGGWSQVVSARRSGQKEEYDERILGSGDFVSAALKEAEERTRLQLKFRETGRTLTRIIEEECGGPHVSPQELRRGSRRRIVSRVRIKIAKRGLGELGFSLAEIARHVGVSTSGIARAIKRWATT